MLYGKNTNVHTTDISGVCTTNSFARHMVGSSLTSVFFFFLFRVNLNRLIPQIQWSAKFDSDKSTYGGGYSPRWIFWLNDANAITVCVKTSLPAVWTGTNRSICIPAPFGYSFAKQKNRWKLTLLYGISSVVINICWSKEVSYCFSIENYIHMMYYFLKIPRWMNIKKETNKTRVYSR